MVSRCIFLMLLIASNGPIETGRIIWRALEYANHAIFGMFFSLRWVNISVMKDIRMVKLIIEGVVVDKG